MTYKIGTIAEFRDWTRQVILDPASAEGVPRQWFDSEAAAVAAGRSPVTAEAMVKLLSPENVLEIDFTGAGNAVDVEAE